MELAPGTLVGSYRVTGVLGAGQMGEVYEAIAPDGAPVAVKVLRAELGTDLGYRFEREARLCASLRSPHVVATCDYGVFERRPFFVMRRLRGADLETWIKRSGALRPEIAVSIALQAAEGLAAAHAANIVHRDFKPANVFLDEDGEGRVTAVVCDFGVAKMLGDGATITASGAILGTPVYMAPEQLLDSKHVDARCDVWALGMTLYHALAGKPALAHVPTIADLVVALDAGAIPPLQSEAPWISGPLARAVHAMLLPREHRTPSVAEAIVTLRRFGPREVPITTRDLDGVSAELKKIHATRAPVPRRHADLAADEPTLKSPHGADPLVGRTIGGRYTLVRRLGAGGMGAVYEASDAGGARVALKLMLGVATPHAEEATRRFLREARASQAIASPHVVRLLDVGVDSGAPYFVMELLRGRDLSQVLAEQGALEPGPVVAIVLQACAGLAAAHALGIVHRDVKPSNLFLDYDDGAIQLKVCDFGIAKMIQPEGAEATTELTHSGGLLGSPLYMSPEQAKSAKSVDARSDVWSLALSLHEALSGRRPWEGRTSMGEIIVAVCTEDVPPLRQLAPWVPEGLAAAIAKGLARDPGGRWPTIEAFADAIRPYAKRGQIAHVDLVSARGRGGTLPIGAAPPKVITADAVSMSHVQRGRARGGVVALAAALAAIGVGGVWAYRAKPAPHPALSAPLPSLAIAVDAAPPPEIAVTVPPPPEPPLPRVVDAGARVAPRPRPQAPVAVSAAPSPSAPPTIGRGVTAIDLPPSN